jgi:hypothetical protein
MSSILGLKKLQFFHLWMSWKYGSKVNIWYCLHFSIHKWMIISEHCMVRRGIFNTSTSSVIFKWTGKYCFLRNYYFMSVSTNKMCGIVVSLFNALFNVTVHAYCAVCAWSLLSVVTETGPSGNITAQYNAISKYMPHTEWRCLLCVRHSLHAWCIWTMTTEIITIAINIS